MTQFNPIINQHELYTQSIALDRVPGDTNFIFGSDIEITTSGVWLPLWSLLDQHQVKYQFPTTAGNIKVASSSALDTGKEVRILYLDSNYQSKIATLTLNGTTPVELIDADMWRINGARVIGLSPAAGNIYLCQETATFTAGVPDDLALVVAHIDPLTQQTSSAIYTVPDNKNAVVRAGVFSNDTTDRVSYRINTQRLSLPNGSLGFVYPETIFLEVRATSGNVVIPGNFTVIAGRVDIILESKVTRGNQEASALLICNLISEKVTASDLQAFAEGVERF